jgi:hypothetical protein
VSRLAWLPRWMRTPPPSSGSRRRARSRAATSTRPGRRWRTVEGTGGVAHVVRCRRPGRGAVDDERRFDRYQTVDLTGSFHRPHPSGLLRELRLHVPAVHDRHCECAHRRRLLQLPHRITRRTEPRAGALLFDQATGRPSGSRGVSPGAGIGGNATTPVSSCSTRHRGLRAKSGSTSSGKPRGSPRRPPFAVVVEAGAASSAARERLVPAQRSDARPDPERSE